MNYYPKILPFYMTYPMPLIWEEEDTVMRDLEYLQELYPRQAKKYRKRIEELLERFDSEGSVLYDEYPDRMTLYLSLIHISEPRDSTSSRMPSSA